MLRCGECGGIMSADRKKKRYTYYHCSGRIKPCKSRAYVRAELLDSVFEEVLSALCLPIEIERSFRESLETTSTDRDEIKAQRLHELRTQLALLTRRLDLLYKDRLDHIISTDAYKTYKGQVEKEYDSVEGEILLVTEMNGSALRGGIEILELLKTLQTRFKEANPAERQLCLSATLSNSVWRDGHLEVTYREPLGAIAFAGIEAQKKTGDSLTEPPVYPVWYTKTEDSPTTLNQALERFRAFFLSPTRATRELIDLFQPLLRG
ncbi:MAG: zinc ribbon domain-containing protein [Bacteroidia bacterium]|nr:zinc ribbon domain-containing protein [Bacteroidia bacterium]